jgi:opine dehydrogenase
MKNRSNEWAIVGMGMGGKGLAAELGLAGYRLRVHDINEDEILDIGRNGGIKVKGRHRDFAPVDTATTDLAKAVLGAHVIIVCTWGTEHARVARDLAPLLVDGQLILLIQGNVGGSLLVRNQLALAGCRADVDVAEFDGYPYMMTVLAPDSVLLTTNKECLQMAALPSTRNDAVMKVIGDAFPMAKSAPNVLHTAFADLGAILHVGAMVPNVGFVESDREYHHYADGMTPSVVRLVTALDNDRVAVSKAYGIPVEPVDDWIFQTYGVRNESLYETIQVMAVTHYKHCPRPRSLGYRFLSQDLSCASVPFATLGDAAGVETPATDAVITVSCALTGIDYWKTGRNLENLGLSGKSAAEILASVAGAEAPA